MIDRTSVVRGLTRRLFILVLHSYEALPDPALYATKIYCCSAVPPRLVQRLNSVPVLPDNTRLLVLRPLTLGRVAPETRYDSVRM